jgi:hypothetical protein
MILLHRDVRCSRAFRVQLSSLGIAEHPSGNAVAMNTRTTVAWGSTGLAAARLQFGS